jgi:alpha-1,2-mannosyltransferase
MASQHTENYTKALTTIAPGKGNSKIQLAFRWDALALLVFTLVALAIAYQAPHIYDLSTPGALLDGFHASEGSGGRRFRWTDGHAQARFEGIGRQPYQLVLILSGPRPNGLEPPLAHVLVNDLERGEFNTTSGTQTYRFIIGSESVGPAGNLNVQINSDTFVPPNDLRTLGVAVSDLRVEPLEGNGFTWPAPLVMVTGATAVIAVFLAAGRRAAWLAALVTLGVLSAGVASERVLTAALIPWAALAAVSLYAGFRIKQHTTWAETAAILAVVFSLAHFVLAFLNLFAISHFTDVLTMFEAAQKLAQGLDPYDYGVILANPLYAHSYVYPPAFAQFLGLLLPLGLQGAIVSWVVLNFLLYFGTLACLLRFFGLHQRSAGMYAMLIVAFNYQPVIDTLYGGQLDILILALLLLSLALAERGHLPASGAALAFAAITKLHPLLVLPFYFACKRLRGLVGFGLAFTLIVVVSLALAPPELYARYATVVLPGRGGGGTGNAENQSLAGFFYRTEGLFWSDTPTSVQESMLRLWTFGAGALLGITSVAIMLYTLARSGDHSDDKVLGRLHFSIFVVLMLLILPTSWMHYETQLVLPLSALLAYGLASRQRAVLVIWTIAAVLTAIANQEIFRGGEFDKWPLSLLQSYKLCGILLVWGTLLWLAIKQGKARPHAGSLGDGANL